MDMAVTNAMQAFGQSPALALWHEMMCIELRCWKRPVAQRANGFVGSSYQDFTSI
jgi:hypothetical protein